MSYKSFLDNIKAKALANVPEEDKEYFEKLAGQYSPIRDMTNLPQPIGPGKDYNMVDIGRIILWNDKLEEYNGKFADGKRAYQAALCGTCHRMKGEGGNSGPDLNNIHTRFEQRDILMSLVSGYNAPNCATHFAPYSASHFAPNCATFHNE